MRKEQTSRTALLIAASLVLLRQEAKYSRFVSPISEKVSCKVLKTSFGARLFVKLAAHRWFRELAILIDRVTIPGILLHYALRKKCIAELARKALGRGVTQVVILGAGIDALSLELQEEFPEVRFWEIDHPATQQTKCRAVAGFNTERIRFIPNEFSHTDFNQTALIETGFVPTEKTLWIAEGLLMYLPAAKLSSLMTSLRTASSLGSQFVFTFMQKGTGERIRFQQQSKAIDWWLQARGEPFLWGATRTELANFIQPWRIVRFFDDNDLRAILPGPNDERLAKGEVICLAEA